MSFAKKAWKSSRLVLLISSALLCACTSATPAAPASTPTGPLLPREQAIEMGLSICNSGHISSPVAPQLDAAELTTNQAIAARLGRPAWAELPADAPIWVLKYTGAFSIAQPPPGKGAPAPPLGPFPACWAIIEARFGARGTVYIPEK